MQMGLILLYSTKRVLTNGIMSGNPNKKLRLDFVTERNIGNEDLWGQDDLTAEEFDMLEIQATQAQNHDAHHFNKRSCAENKLEEVNDLKHLQYELEGRMKLLSHSLEKTVKDLNEERSNRQKIIGDKIKEFSVKEDNLKKEIQKMQSIIDFKEQEVKTVYSKLQLMKSYLPKKSNAETSHSRNFEDFLKSSSFHIPDASCKSSSSNFQRKNKLSVDMPQGKARSIDILSSVLSTRFAIPLPSFENLASNSLMESISSNVFTPISIIHLKNEQKIDGLLEYYICILKNYITHLKTVSSKNTVSNSSKTSPLSARQKETSSNIALTSCLKDFISLLYSESTASVGESITNSTRSCVCSNVQDDLSSIAAFNLFSHEASHKKNRNISFDGLSPALESLLELSNPNAYPVSYPTSETTELSLSALLTVFELYPEEFIGYISELSICFLISPQQNITSLCAALKLLICLSLYKDFDTHLIHKNGHCLLCSVAVLCNTIFNHPKKFSFCMNLVEDFLSSILTVHLSEIQLHSPQCISEVIQNLVLSLLKYLPEAEDANGLGTVILRKGFMLLHFMSSCISNFKEKRNVVEDEYISLISGLLTLSKENLEFREFYDLLHNLWDFQTDISEFDLDESPEETQTSNSEIDIAE